MKSYFNIQLIKDLADCECGLNEDFKERHMMYDVFDKKLIIENMMTSIQDIRDMRKCVNVLNG